MSSTAIVPTPARLWHASATELPVGTVLSPRPDYEARWHAYSAGAVLESLRPVGALAHRDAVFLCDDPQDCDNCGASCDWLFEVAVSAPVQRHDLSWASEIDALVSDGCSPDEPAVVERARRYWAGEPSSLPTWEYLAPSATVTDVEPY